MFELFKLIVSVIILNLLGILLFSHFFHSLAHCIWLYSGIPQCFHISLKLRHLQFLITRPVFSALGVHVVDIAQVHQVIANVYLLHEVVLSEGPDHLLARRLSEVVEAQVAAQEGPIWVEHGSQCLTAFIAYGVVREIKLLEGERDLRSLLEC